MFLLIGVLDTEGLLCGLAFCGKGRCEDSKEIPFVNCICDEGWTNFYNNSHLPCVIPNCIFSFSSSYDTIPICLIIYIMKFTIKELLIFVGTIDFSCGHGSPWPPLPPFQLPDPLNYNRTCNLI